MAAAMHLLHQLRYLLCCFCRGANNQDICGLVLVKELLQFWRSEVLPTVKQLDLRHLPRIPADTPMFDVLRLFQVWKATPVVQYPGVAWVQDWHCCYVLDLPFVSRACIPDVGHVHNSRPGSLA